MKHYMIQHQHERAHYSYHACGGGDMQSGRESAYDWSDVTCPACLAKAPPHTKKKAPVLRLKTESPSCDCDIDADCDCAAHPTCAVLLNGLGGYGMGQWVLDPTDGQEKLQMTTLWGEFCVSDSDEAKEELGRRLKPINPELVIHGY